ncbi:hypothetical protein [Kribbibacterium absianum]|uniref:hypothetical protein n=1 Tax=Kribbibacterium absianum TaxID=3044210 RepID=UPI0024BD512E|nr:hypothetical protein [Olsenella sp. YH-ols2216]
MRVEVQDRVQQRHPEVSKADVVCAWNNARAMRTRDYGPPDLVCAAGPDTHGRMIEMIGVVTLDGLVSVFHAMRLTEKMARELDLM